MTEFRNTDIGFIHPTMPSDLQHLDGQPLYAPLRTKDDLPWPLMVEREHHKRLTGLDIVSLVATWLLGVCILGLAAYGANHAINVLVAVLQ